MTFDELAERIAQMTPEERSKPVLGFDDEAGEFVEVVELVRAEDFGDGEEEIDHNQWVLDYGVADYEFDDSIEEF